MYPGVCQVRSGLATEPPPLSPRLRALGVAEDARGVPAARASDEHPLVGEIPPLDRALSLAFGVIVPAGEQVHVPLPNEGLDDLLVIETVGDGLEVLPLHLLRVDGGEEVAPLRVVRATNHADDLDEHNVPPWHSESNMTCIRTTELYK